MWKKDSFLKEKNKATINPISVAMKHAEWTALIKGFKF